MKRRSAFIWTSGPSKCREDELVRTTSWSWMTTRSTSASPSLTFSLLLLLHSSPLLAVPSDSSWSLGLMTSKPQSKVFKTKIFATKQILAFGFGSVSVKIRTGTGLNCSPGPVCIWGVMLVCKYTSCFIFVRCYKS